MLYTSRNVSGYLPTLPQHWSLEQCQDWRGFTVRCVGQHCALRLSFCCSHMSGCGKSFRLLHCTGCKQYRCFADANNGIPLSCCTGTVTAGLACPHCLDVGVWNNIKNGEILT